MTNPKKKKAIVLSGGGAKGAYEAGALKYIIENWGLAFDIVVGTSAGALNGFLYSALDPCFSNKTNAEKMIQPWIDIEVNKVLRLPLNDFIKGKFNSIFDNRQLYDFIKTYFIQEIQTSNIKNNILNTLIVTTGELSSGQAHVWYVSNNPDLKLTSKRWTSHKLKNLSVDHALASGAIPGIFRAVELEDEYGIKLWHNDGGVVMNTPISPAIQAGADKVLVIYMGNPETPAAELIPNILEVLVRTGFTIVYNHLKEDIIRATIINDLLDKLGQPTFEGYKKVALSILRPIRNLDIKTNIELKEKYFLFKLIPEFVMTTISGSGLFMSSKYTNILIKEGYDNAKIMHAQLEEFFNDD